MNYWIVRKIVFYKIIRDDYWRLTCPLKALTKHHAEHFNNARSGFLVLTQMTKCLKFRCHNETNWIKLLIVKLIGKFISSWIIRWDFTTDWLRRSVNLWGLSSLLFPKSLAFIQLSFCVLTHTLLTHARSNTTIWNLSSN